MLVATDCPTEDRKPEWKQIVRLVVPRLSRDERQQFEELVGAAMRRSTKTQLEQHASFEWVARLSDLHRQQRDAYHKFLAALIETGMEHDAEFFGRHALALERLRQEINVEPPSKEDVRTDVDRELELRLREPSSR